MNRKSSLLDPRSHLVLAVSAAAVLMALDGWPAWLIATGALLAAILLTGVLKAWLIFFRGLGPAVFGFLAVAWLAFDFATASTAGLRLLALGTVFFLFFQVTSPTELANALGRLGLPYVFSFVLTVSLEFIPVLARRAANIRDAQRARGIPLEGGLRAIRYLPALLGPLLIQAFKLADEMAEALEARGFGSEKRRPRRELRFRFRDWFMVSMCLAGLLAFFLFSPS